MTLAKQITGITYHRDGFRVQVRSKADLRTARKMVFADIGETATIVKFENAFINWDGNEFLVLFVPDRVPSDIESRWWETIGFE